LIIIQVVLNCLLLFAKENKTTMVSFKASQLLALLENTDTGLIVTDFGGKVLYANEYFMDLMAVADSKDIEGTDFEKWISKDHLADFRTFTAAAIELGVRKNSEFYFVAADKKTMALEICSLRSTSEAGTCLQYIARDISRQKLIENRLREAKEKAEESNKLKTAFLANLSHEVRTPMNAIMGFSELLLSDNIPQAHKEKYINYINNSGAVLLNLIDDIIDIAKMQSGQLAVKKISCDLSSILYDLHSSYSQLIKTQKGDNVKLMSEGAVPRGRIKLMTDPLRFRQIFTNLLNNAIKYTDTGSISFGCNYDAAIEGKRLQFYVSDTGIGLSQENKDAIFDRFYKIEDDKLKFYRGAGLGLTISKNLVSLLGGNIWVESEVGKGSRFYFQFPIEDAFISISERPETKSEIDYSMLENKKILVAEDEEINFIYLDELLKRYKAEVIHARNGQEALDIVIADSSIDLVLMDIKMPVMDGYEATRLIKDQRPSLPIIAQTAYALAGEKDKIIQAGCDDYLSKPIKPISLFKLLSQFLVAAN
jgi:signal transduction histidine kinase/CheY-like chemotaxis protein